MTTTEADRILLAVCEAADVSLSALLSDRRARHIARPRQLAMKLIRDRTPMSLPQIGRKVGGRDHSTVMHAPKAWGRAIARGEPGMAELEARVAEILDGEPAGDRTPGNHPETPAELPEKGGDPAPKESAPAPKPATPMPAPATLGMRAKSVLRALHRIGADATFSQVCDDQNIEQPAASQAVSRLVAAGYVTTRQEGSRKLLTAVRDVAGEPKRPPHRAPQEAPSGAPKAAKPAPRDCNRCGRTFQPAHRFNRRCGDCEAVIRHSPDHAGAAPGMEFV